MNHKIELLQNDTRESINFKRIRISRCKDQSKYKIFEKSENCTSREKYYIYIWHMKIIHLHTFNCHTVIKYS